MINQNTMHPDFDVVIVGGGPSGCTTASLLRKYNPELSVVIIEKEKFPREHIGESQLPSISPILDEMGVWDKVEAANFPIKIGASYTWGKDDDRWDFDFFPVEQFQDDERPSKYEGQRKLTAFQVDRAIYDDILLRHAEELGAEVWEETAVTNVLVEDGERSKRVAGLELSNGKTVTGKHYIDASGVVGLLRRALGIQSEAPKELRNLAVWDYWDNAEWAVEIGKGATRVQVRSLPYGWIWFIPMGPTRTSIGLIVPVDYIKEKGVKPADLYLKAVREQADISKLIANATPEGNIDSCRDWSHKADLVVGDNWFLAGESAGFADPILAAGMALAHNAGREAAYTILELERGEYERDWLLDRYNERNRTYLEQHIRFAQYWYAANGQFDDLRGNCVAIAKEAGLDLKPQQAWAWLSQGGFTAEGFGKASFGPFDLASTKRFVELFGGEEDEIGWNVSKYNVLTLQIDKAEKCWIGELKEGKIRRVLSYRRGNYKLPRSGMYLELINILKTTDDVATVFQRIQQRLAAYPEANRGVYQSTYLQALDLMIEQGWIKGSRDKNQPMLTLKSSGSKHIRTAEEADKALAEAGREDILKTNM